MVNEFVNYRRNMFVIGLTGGIGTGKGEVARVLSELGAEIIEADEVAHETYRPGTSGWQQIVDEFGERVLTSTGTVDRNKLGAIVFGDKKALRRLNTIVHPLTRSLIEQRLKQLREFGAHTVVVEVPLLVEAVRKDVRWTSLIDEIWATDAEEANVVERVRRRSGLDAEATKARVQSQVPSEERLAQADVVIGNNGTLADLKRSVRRLWADRVKPKRKQQSQV